MFASIPVLGRQAGPVLQDLGAKKEKSRSLSMEIVLAPATGLCTDFVDSFVTQNPINSAATSGTILGIINGANPSGAGATQVFIAEQDDSWEPTSGRFNFNIKWVYED